MTACGTNFSHEIKPGLEAAIAAAGSQSDLARLLEVSPAAVSQWVQLGFVPPPRALEIETKLGVPRRKLVDPALLRMCGCDDLVG